MATITDTSSSMVVVECPSCHIRYAIPKGLYNDRLSDHGVIRCPQGHGWYYPQQTDAELEREAREEAQRLLQRAMASRDDYIRRLRSTRGQVTKLRKRLGLEVE